MTITPHEITVRRSARYYTIGEATASTRECWVVGHGYGQLAERFAKSFVSLGSADRCIIAPEGLSRFYVDTAMREKVGASWMTKEQRESEITDYVAYLDAVYEHVMLGRKGVRLTALGFSQGASTLSRWAAFGRHAVDRLILWGGELPPDLDLGAVQERFTRLEVVVVRGTNDGLITEKVARSAMKRLEEVGVRARLVEFEGGHEIDKRVLADLS
jgi:predicted esterase